MSSTCPLMTVTPLVSRGGLLEAGALLASGVSGGGEGACRWLAPMRAMTASITTSHTTSLRKRMHTPYLAAGFASTQLSACDMMTPSHTCVPMPGTSNRSTWKPSFL